MINIKYHFHRIFKFIVGESIRDYIRRVRLQSTTLQFNTNRKITDIAITSGYETNASFSKAFKKHFGITPKEFAKSGIKLRELPIIEKYLNKDPRRTKPENLRTEIYVPIV